LHLHRASKSGDLVQIVVTIAKYTSSFGFYAKISHLEGEIFFGSTKHKVYLPPRSKVDSHWHDQVNFSCLKVANAMAPINKLLNIDVGEGNNIDLVVTHNGAEVLECLCGDDI
jgi:hypothetical protein